MVVVAGIVQHWGYEGLAAATLIAGLLLIGAARIGLGSTIRYIPFPVVTGFTAGIAVVIFASQLGDMLGLRLGHVPADTLGKLAADAAALSTFDPAAAAIAAATLAAIVAIRRLAPRAPAFLIALTLAGAAAWLLGLPIATIASRFGALPSALPAPHVPSFDLASLGALLPAAFTIFLLGGIESLLSATVADGMTGRRHHANGELMAQGLANIASAVMGGMPATGAIARTATNIRAGAETPVAGIVHAAAILLMMALLAPLAGYIPLAALGAVLAVVCWNMAEAHVFALVLQGAPGDRAVLIATFLLTIFVDLSFAIAAGVVLAALIFARDMAGLSAAAVPPAPDRATLPPGVEVFALSGPLFFAAAAEAEDVLSRSGGVPRVLILRMSAVPLIDATGAAALGRLIRSARARGTEIVLCELAAAPTAVLRSLEIAVHQAPSLAEAVALARHLLDR